MSKSLQRAQLSEEAIEMIARRFKLLGEPTRLKLLIALEAGEKNVSALIKATGATQANVSRHLGALASAGLLTRRRDGATIYYRVVDSAVFDMCEHVCGSLQAHLARHGKAARLFGG